MIWPRARVVVFACASASLAGAASACGYDWTVRDQGASDASAVEGGALGDGGASRDSASADVGDVGDGAHDADATPCSALTSSLQKAADRAQTCALSSGECQTKIVDECGCGRFVAVASSNDSQAWQSAIAAFTDAGCAPSCVSGCAPATSGVCVLQGGNPRCSP